ncbi:MAG: hypothetical protein IJB79_07615 [Candidatus Gastranaerophilales bacterium]|nr:hypothetical protein [Candidatus Gastranaerophilales bacterium]
MQILKIPNTRYINFNSKKRINQQNATTNIAKAQQIQKHANTIERFDKKRIKDANVRMLAALGCKFDDLNHLTPEILHLEDIETILRFVQLKNGSFSRKLTDDEAWLLSKPYSIKLADECEAQNEIYFVDEKVKFEKRASKKYFTRRMNNEEVENFIALKDYDYDFATVNQIMRYLELTSPYHGLSRNLTTQEARYFAKKCSSFFEIQGFIDQIENSPELKAVYENISKNNYTFTYRTQQTNGKKELCLKTDEGNFQKIYTFIDGKLTSQIKNHIPEYGKLEAWDATKRTTSFISYSQLPYKQDSAIYTKSILEILNNKKGEVDRITQTTFGEDCIADTKTFKLDEYDENIDVLSKIQEETIKPSAHTTEKTTNKDGSTTIIQSYQTQDTSSKRTFSEKENGWTLSYTIKDSKGENLYSTERSFEKIGKNTTLTIINGIRYVANFDDKTKKINITRQDGKTFQIEEITGNGIAYGDFDFDEDYTEKTDDLWEFCKNKLPADLIIILNYYQTLIYPIEEELDSEFTDFNAIFTGQNAGILAHEIGHMLSRGYSAISEMNSRISQNNILKSIYEDELEEFNKNNSKSISKNAIEYFNETGSTKDKKEEEETPQARSIENFEELNINTGLEEIVAECMYIKTIPIVKNPVIALRTHYLMMHFPKTIAFANILLEELCLEIL